MNGKKKRSILSSILLPVAVCAVMILAIVYASGDASESAGKQRYEQTVKNMSNAITTCYSIEGRYPPSLKYLVDNYGLRYNEDEYIISYDVFATNIRPSFQVVPIGNSGGEYDE